MGLCICTMMAKTRLIRNKQPESVASTPQDCCIPSH